MSFSPLNGEALYHCCTLFVYCLSKLTPYAASQISITSTRFSSFTSLFQSMEANFLKMTVKSSSTHSFLFCALGIKGQVPIEVVSLDLWPDLA